MGEYAVRKSDGTEIKIGTCEMMYYIRYEDRAKVSYLPGNVNTSTEDGLFWRLPFPDEDSTQPGEYEAHNRGERLYKKEGDYYTDMTEPEIAEQPGTIQLTHPSGLLVNVPCHHGEKLPNCGDAKVFWNGKSWSLELVHVKNMGGKVYPIVNCRHCGKMWRFDWEDVLPYVHGEMKKRLEKYAE